MLPHRAAPIVDSSQQVVVPPFAEIPRIAGNLGVTLLHGFESLQIDDVRSVLVNLGVVEWKTLAEIGPPGLAAKVLEYLQKIEAPPRGKSSFKFYLALRELIPEIKAWHGYLHYHTLVSSDTNHQKPMPQLRAALLDLTFGNFQRLEAYDPHPTQPSPHPHGAEQVVHLFRNLQATISYEEALNLSAHIAHICYCGTGEGSFVAYDTRMWLALGSLCHKARNVGALRELILTTKLAILALEPARVAAFYKAHSPDGSSYGSKLQTELRALIKHSNKFIKVWTDHAARNLLAKIERDCDAIKVTGETVMPGPYWKARTWERHWDDCAGYFGLDVGYCYDQDSSSTEGEIHHSEYSPAKRYTPSSARVLVLPL